MRIEDDRRPRSNSRVEQIAQLLEQSRSSALQISRCVASLRQTCRMEQVVAVDQEVDRHQVAFFPAGNVWVLARSRL
jgi:hypothetical protein